MMTTMKLPKAFGYDGDGTRCPECGERIHYNHIVIDVPDEALMHEDCAEEWAKTNLVDGRRIDGRAEQTFGAKDLLLRGLDQRDYDRLDALQALDIDCTGLRVEVDPHDPNYTMVSAFAFDGRRATASFQNDAQRAVKWAVVNTVRGNLRDANADWEHARQVVNSGRLVVVDPDSEFARAARGESPSRPPAGGSWHELAPNVLSGLLQGAPTNTVENRPSPTAKEMAADLSRGFVQEVKELARMSPEVWARYRDGFFKSLVETNMQSVARMLGMTEERVSVAVRTLAELPKLTEEEARAMWAKLEQPRESMTFESAFKNADGSKMTYQLTPGDRMLVGVDPGSMSVEVIGETFFTSSAIVDDMKQCELRDDSEVFGSAIVRVQRSERDFVDDCQRVLELHPIAIEDVDRLVAEFYAIEGNAAGGFLHIVLDDANLSDASIESCIRDASEVLEVLGSDMVLDPRAAALGRLLLKMPYKDRWKLDAICPCCVVQYVRNET